MSSPYRDAPSRGEGLADRDPNVATRRWTLGCLGAIGVGLVALFSGPLALYGAALAIDGDPGATFFFGVAAGVPCMLAFATLLAVPMVALVKQGGADVAVLDAIRAELGGALRVPRWYAIGTLPMLVGEIDGQRVRVATYPMPRGRMSLAMELTSGDWASMHPGGVFAPRLSITMYTNHRAPYRLALLSRTALAGLGAGAVGLSEVPLPPPLSDRIACFTDQPARLQAALADPSLVGALAELVESNLPFFSRISFVADGATWESVAPSRTSGAEMAWRFRRMGAIAAHLAR